MRKGKRLIALGEFDSQGQGAWRAPNATTVMTEDETRRPPITRRATHSCRSTSSNDPLHKVTIILRGRALGVTWNLPERDRYSMSMKQMKARPRSASAAASPNSSSTADELNTGASNDIQQATDMARSMVMEYGMSDKLGWLRYRDNQDEVFLGHSVSRAQNMSEETAKRSTPKSAARRGRREDGAAGHRPSRRTVPAPGALLEYETLSGEEGQRLAARTSPR